MSRKSQAFDRTYGSVERVEWVQRQPCWICGTTPSENAHVKSGGMSRKADAQYIVPLCFTHHAEYHRGVKTFAAAHAMVDLEFAATIIDARYEAYRSQFPLFPPEMP